MDYFLLKTKNPSGTWPGRSPKNGWFRCGPNWTKKRNFPGGRLKYLAEVGLFGVYIPEEYGGLGLRVF